jgi:hypothetical protein
MNTNFCLDIINQHWLYEKSFDLCSHGEIALKVDNTIITNLGLQEQWGISESALAMLRTAPH